MYYVGENKSFQGNFSPFSRNVRLKRPARPFTSKSYAWDNESFFSRLTQIWNSW